MGRLLDLRGSESVTGQLLDWERFGRMRDPHPIDLIGDSYGDADMGFVR